MEDPECHNHRRHESRQIVPMLHKIAEAARDNPVTSERPATHIEQYEINAREYISARRDPCIAGIG